MRANAATLEVRQTAAAIQLIYCAITLFSSVVVGAQAIYLIGTNARGVFTLTAKRIR
jgi:hypothetical protein